METSYKEKYEQALAHAREIHRNEEEKRSDMEWLFPELKESGDEKVRKALIDFFSKGAKYGGHTNGVYDKDILAWLEKQGQVKKSFIYQHENRTCKENDDSLTSEDEMIRKALLEMVHDTTGDELLVDYGVHKEEALAWLERQGEHANFRNKIQVGDKVTRNEAGVLVNLSQLKRVAKPSEKQGEQKPQRMISAEAKEAMYDKPADTVEPKFKVGDKIYLKPEYRMPNDDTPIANTVKEIKRIDDKHYRFDGSYIFVEDQDKYELVEQKPAEWSEEDEKILKEIISDVKFEGYNNDMQADSYKKIAWLKSLRPQNRWKPSELQLGCLSDAIEHYNSLGYPAPKLKELLDDLKELKGEV